MKKTIAALSGTALLLLIIHLSTSCKKEPLNPFGDFDPTDTTVINLLDSIILDTTTTLLNNDLKAHLNSLAPPTLPPPNQNQQVDEEISAEGADLKICTTKVFTGTSPEHGELLLPNPIDPFVPSWLYQLNSILDGSNTPIIEGMGGERTIILQSGAYSNSIVTGSSQSEILAAISQLQQTLPENHAQNVDIKVEEIFSAQQAAAHFAASYSGTFMDFAGSLDYAKEEYSHKYMAVVKVSDFSIKVQPRQYPLQWFPGLDSTNFDAIGGWSPVYVDHLVYGKYLMLLIETNYEESALSAALSASFEGVFTSGEFDSNGSYKALNDVSKISIKAIGGSLGSVIGLINGGREGLKTYLEETAKDKTGATAAPLFAQFRFFRDLSHAKVVLATDEYKVKECRTIATDEEIIDFSITDAEKFIPVLYDGDNHIGHSWIRVDVQTELEIRNSREVWAKVNMFYREVTGPNGSFKNTDAKVVKEIKLGTTEKEIIQIMSASVYNTGANPHWVPAPDPHHPWLFELNDPTSLIAKVEANSGQDDPEFPSNGAYNKAWVKLYFNDIVLKTKGN